jgi:hypothetical protein
MRSDARSDAVKKMVAGIRRHATIIAIKRQALAAALVPCDRRGELCVVAHAYPTTDRISKPRPRARPLLVIANDNAARMLRRCLVHRIKI